MLDFLKNFWKKIIKKEPKVLGPKEFFNKIKESKNEILEEDLKKIEDLCLKKAEQFVNNGQINASKRIMFHYKNLAREKEAINAGFNIYVLLSDIDNFINNVSKRVVKITEISSFLRDIPEEASKRIEEARPLFDDMYILFTDYTGEEEKRIKKEEREKDPIVFGVFREKIDGVTIFNHRFYYICDWVDEYCDLTLDQYIVNMHKAGYETPIHTENNLTEDYIQSLIDAETEDKNKDRLKLVL